MKKTQCVIRRAVTLVAAVLLTTARTDMTFKGPLVKGDEAYSVRLDQSEEFKWYAPLFVGQHFQWMDVLYDTMSDWTVIDQEYDPDRSATASPWLDDEYNIYNDVTVGPNFYSGPIFNESMCLIRRHEINNLCVRQAPMVLAPIGDDLNGYQGVLGLSHGEMNYVKLLKDAFVLQKNVVSLDYDTHVQHPSSIRFGDFDLGQTKDEALFVLPNAQQDKWTLKVTSATFGDKQVQSGERMAHIDSGNATIQLPRDVYDKVFREMKSVKYDEYVKFREEYEYGQRVKVIKASAECDDIVDDLPILEFKVAPGVTIVIEPRSYVFPPKDDDFYCTISLAKTFENEYRFGTQFLKNFYTVLDFDANQIMLGSKSKHAEIFGDDSLLYKEPEPEPIPDPEPEKPDDDVPADGTDQQDKGDDEKTEDQDTGKTDDEQSQDQPETPDDDDEEQPDDGEQPDDEEQSDDEPVDDDEDQHEDEPDTHDDPKEHHEEEHHEEEHHEEEHHEEEHHEEEHHEEKPKPKPKPAKKPEKKQPPAPPAPPAKPKTWFDTYIIDPIMNPIMAVWHFLEKETELITNMIMSPIKMLTSIKLF